MKGLEWVNDSMGCYSSKVETNLKVLSFPATMTSHPTSDVCGQSHTVLGDVLCLCVMANSCACSVILFPSCFNPLKKCNKTARFFRFWNPAVLQDNLDVDAR